MAYIFCHSKYRKHFYCDYLGIKNSLDLWEFTIRPKNNMPWNLNEKDELKCHVYLDKSGIISRIEVQLTNHSEVAISYLLETDYTLFKRKLMASRSKIKLLPNANNETTPEISLLISYSLPKNEK